MSRRSSFVALAVVAVLALVSLSGCQVARVGARCRTTKPGEDATFVLVCKKGRWVRVISKADGQRLLNAWLASRTTTTPAPTTTTATTTTTTAPPAPLVAKFSKIDGGYQHSCAIGTGGVVKCVGYDSYGELGDGSTSTSTTPVTNGVTNATSISAGSETVCALLATGSIKCWGYNLSGGVGSGTQGTTSTPVTVSGITDATSVNAGPETVCATVTGAAVKCWGNVPGLGNNLSPVTVPGLTAVKAVPFSNASYSVCALVPDGTVSCWGANEAGQLGDGTTNATTTPAAVPGLSGMTDVTANRSTACAVKSNGTVWCWGDGSGGQLGNGTNTAAQTTPVQVSGITDASAVTVGNNFACALRTTGAVKCWGSFALGDGVGNPTNTPVDVSGISTATGIGSGFYHACVTLADASAWCWGNGGLGRLGNGSNSAQLAPVAFAGIPS